MPFNFGGPQPETAYPLPDDAQQWFNYIGEGSWESTRNLRLSARDGFLPWVIIGAVAPRCLIYAHEFSWDEPKDPVWKRLRAIYGFCEAPHNITSLCGWGRVQLSPAQASHCNNIGPPHRKQIYPALQRWFGMAVPQEFQARRAPAELACLEGIDSSPALPMTPVHRLADRIAEERMAAFRAELAPLTPAARQGHAARLGRPAGRHRAGRPARPQAGPGGRRADPRDALRLHACARHRGAGAGPPACRFAILLSTMRHGSGSGRKGGLPEAPGRRDRPPPGPRNRRLSVRFCAAPARRAWGRTAAARVRRPRCRPAS